MSRKVSTTKINSKIFIILLITSIILLGACVGCKKNNSTTAQPDSEGDIISDKTTGIKLPQSVQTIPSENSTARLSRINSVGGGGK